MTLTPPPETLIVTPEEAGLRLDKFITARAPALSRTRVQALIEAGAVALAGGTVTGAGDKVRPGAVYSLAIPPARAAEPEAEAIALAIVHEDAHLIVIDKPAGLVVHPAPGAWTGTLVNALIAHCGDSLSGIGGVRRPGIVHRLDKDTSGLLVAAKTDMAHQGLAALFAAHGADGGLERRYRALVWGALDRPAGVIDAPLGRSAGNRTKMAVVAEQRGRRAVTRYKALEQMAAASLLELELETGRTHQIRVHLAHIGHPVLGDPVYGTGFAASARKLDEPARAALTALRRQALHAAVLGFEHPATGRRMRFESALPDDMAALLRALRAEQSDAPRRAR